ncbi:hypothetical protein [Natronobacterium texcoconense]|uniref:Uncharacterized protein n=1 Tax=Natronobacterium texcoconense TaxID=1095778 RepID=A0A1H1FG86_NATTX|nr:hypothetical protein [Natronobacterium texcoconense]SDR00042.1 hypothetical protein SAMN04489842_1960 [Natronobacterium texcoconense]
MNRRAMLAVLGTTTFAGCVSEGPGDTGETNPSRTDDGSDGASGVTGDGTILSHFDDNPSRPDCEKESTTIEVKRGDEIRKEETAETIPYPEPPRSFAEDDVVEFVETFDHAYVTQDVLCDGRSGHALRIAHTVETRETFDWHEDLTTVFLLRAAGVPWGADEQGYEWQAEIPFTGVVYAVDETGVARAEAGEIGTRESDKIESQIPDPLEDGELVAIFE